MSVVFLSTISSFAQTAPDDTVEGTDLGLSIEAWYANAFPHRNSHGATKPEQHLLQV
ncbi:MAG: hypothetical protein QM485_08570 [Flavobacteriaceae bacterium]